MDIFIYDNKALEFIKLPVVPQTVEIQAPQKIETFESIGQGDLKIIGNKGTRTLTLSSFFPVIDYPFLRDRSMKGMQYVEKIERWRDLKVPLIILIPDMLITFFIVINDASYSIKDGSGDIYYNLNIEEYRTPILKKTSKNEVITTSEQNQGKTDPSKTIDYFQNAYGTVTVKEGLNVRSGPGVEYSNIGTIQYNQNVKLFKLENNNKWWQIDYGGRIGYVISDYIRRVS